MKLIEVYNSLDKYIASQEELHHIDREVNCWQLEELSKLADQFDSIIHYEPTDQEMMASFGTKWHDAL